MNSRIMPTGAAWVLAMAFALTGCGGGGGSEPEQVPPPNGGGTSDTALAMAGSITVAGAGATVTMNGVALTTSGATTVRIDDTAKSPGDLQKGMVGKVRGRLNSDGATGTATSIEIENEVRGHAANVDASANPKRFTVNKQLVLVDGMTEYATPNKTFSDISEGATFGGGTYVEVHGFRDSTGYIRATRVEAKTAVVGDDEIRGNADLVNATARTFTLRSGPRFSPGGVIVNFAGATFTNGSESGLSADSPPHVEVHGSYDPLSGVFTATRIDFEDLEDSAFAPAPPDIAQGEGLVNGYSASTQEFRVGRARVMLGSSVRFEGGNADDLGENIHVEVEGTVDSAGVLTASKVQFRSARIVLQGTASSVLTGFPDNPGSLVVLEKTIEILSVTLMDTATKYFSTDIRNGDCVEIRARLDGSRLIADSLKELSASACDRWIIRGPVVAQSSASGTVTLIAASGQPNSATVTVTGAQFRDKADAAISRDAFFAGATVGSIVKTRGTGGVGLGSATEAELEN